MVGSGAGGVAKGRPMGDGRDSVEIRVRYAETDQMGRAHHSHYLVWFELGRTAYMRERGVSYAELERDGLLLPVGRAALEYRRGVGFDDPVRVETAVTQVRSRSIVFGYRLTHGDSGEVLALGSTELFCTNSAGRPMRIPADLRSALEAATA